MKLLATLLFMTNLFGIIGHAQTTLVLQPNASDGKDALLHGLSSESNVNHGNSEQFTATAWTFNGEFGIVRGIIDFDLSAIPSGATIIDSKLDLYGWESTTGFGPHSQLSGNNDFLLQRVISSWDENLVTWNTAPNVTNLNEVTFAGTSVQGLSYLNMDVSDLVQDMVDFPAASHGFLMRLQNENYYRQMNFFSSDATDPAKRPRLTVIYQESQDSVICETLKPGAQSGKDAIIHGLSSESNVNHGNSPQFTATAWTFAGTPAVVRSLIEFDISHIPSTAVVQTATLDLYAWGENSGFGPHSTLSGSNEFYIRRITTPWDEQTVTWNTAPAFTTQNQIMLPASTASDQDYLGIPVDGLVQDLVSDPSNGYGLQISLVNENYYRMMNFCSSDHSDINKLPSMEVCYTDATSLVNEFSLNNDIDLIIYPNVAGDYINILTVNINPNDILQCSILNSAGQLVKELKLQGEINKTDISNLEKGIYFLKMVDADQNSITKKFIKQ